MVRSADPELATQLPLPVVEARGETERKETERKEREEAAAQSVVEDLTAVVGGQPRAPVVRRTWHEWMDELHRFATDNGGRHCPPIGHVTESGACLGSWVSRVRTMAVLMELEARGLELPKGMRALTQREYDTLNTLTGWKWSHDIWTEQWMCTALRCIKLIQGNHGVLPSRKTIPADLLKWMDSQHRRYVRLTRGVSKHLVCYASRFRWLENQCAFFSLIHPLKTRTKRRASLDTQRAVGQRDGEEDMPFNPVAFGYYNLRLRVGSTDRDSLKKRIRRQACRDAE